MKKSLTAQLLTDTFNRRIPGLPTTVEETEPLDGEDFGDSWEPYDDERADPDYDAYWRDFPASDPRD